MFDSSGAQQYHAFRGQARLFFYTLRPAKATNLKRAAS
jgi:hypothetical protein